MSGIGVCESVRQESDSGTRVCKVGTAVEVSSDVQVDTALEVASGARVGTAWEVATGV